MPVDNSIIDDSQIIDDPAELERLMNTTPQTAPSQGWYGAPNVGPMEQVGNLWNAGVEGVQNMFNTLPQVPGQIQSAISTQANSMANYQDPFALTKGMFVAPTAGALEGARNIWNGLGTLPAQTFNAAHGGQYVDPVWPTIPKEATFPDLRAAYPVSSFAGEQIPSMLPAIGASRLVSNPLTKTALGAAADAGVSAVQDPGEGDFGGRLANVAAGTVMGAVAPHLFPGGGKPQLHTEATLIHQGQNLGHIADPNTNYVAPQYGQPAPMGINVSQMAPDDPRILSLRKLMEYEAAVPGSTAVPGSGPNQALQVLAKELGLTPDGVYKAMGAVHMYDTQIAQQAAPKPVYGQPSPPPTPQPQYKVDPIGLPPQPQTFPNPVQPGQVMGQLPGSTAYPQVDPAYRAESINPAYTQTTAPGQVMGQLPGEVDPLSYQVGQDISPLTTDMKQWLYQNDPVYRQQQLMEQQQALNSRTQAYDESANQFFGDQNYDRLAALDQAIGVQQAGDQAWLTFQGKMQAGDPVTVRSMMDLLSNGYTPEDIQLYLRTGEVRQSGAVDVGQGFADPYTGAPLNPKR